jgi:hypothetical protein
MHRVRRGRHLTSVAVLLAVGALVLAGCRSDPQVAAYVGSTRYSDDRVTAIADEAQAKLQDLADAQQSASGASSRPVQRPVTDQEVVTALVSRDVLKALAQEKKVNPLSVDANQVAQQVRVPADTEYVRVLTEKDGYRLALLQKAPSAEPSEADLREVYDNLVKASGGRITGSFDQFTSSLAEQDTELIGRSAGVRRDVTAESEKLDVTVNPRYGPTMLSLVDIADQQGGVHSLLGVPLDARESGVRDLS